MKKTKKDKKRRCGAKEYRHRVGQYRSIRRCYVYGNIYTSVSHLLFVHSTILFRVYVSHIIEFLLFISHTI